MKDTAKWIWHKGIHDVNEYVDFIREFETAIVDENAYFQISADSEYVLWINGEFISCGQYSDFPENKIYDEIRVGKFLKTGKNRICISAYYQGESSLRYKKGERGLIFNLQNGAVSVVSDSKTLCRISDSYTNGQIHKTTWQMGFGFEYDARKYDNFQKNEYEINEDWKNSVEKNISTVLEKRPVKKTIIKNECSAKIISQGNYIRKCSDGTTADKMYSDYLSFSKFSEFFAGEKSFPINISEKSSDGDGIYFIVDLEKESCGYLHFVLSASSGTRVDIAHGEHLDDLRVRSKIIARNFADTYICSDGKQSFTHYYRRIAGRYIQVHISGFEELCVEYMGIKSVEYPFEDEARFECSDKLHNKIFQTCLDTLKLCMHEHYEDCPWREQALYGMDGRNAAICSYYAFADFEFARASLDLLLKSLVENTYIGICAPSDIKTLIPAFTMTWLMAVKEYTQYSADVTLAKENWKKIRDMAERFCLNEENGIYKQIPLKGDIKLWTFYEWASDYEEFRNELTELEDNASDGLYHIFTYMGISSAIYLAECIGDNEFKIKYTKVLAEMKQAFNSIFYDVEKGVFASHVAGNKKLRYDELTQALAVYSGICDEDKEDKVLSSLADTNNRLIKITLSNSIYKYEALLSKGMKYADLVFDEIAEKWGNMLFKGASSFWETALGSEDFNGAGSLCHAWSAVPLFIYCKYILGITAENGKMTIMKDSPCSDVFAHYRGYVPNIGVTER